MYASLAETTACPSKTAWPTFFNSTMSSSQSAKATSRSFHTTFTVDWLTAWNPSCASEGSCDCGMTWSHCDYSCGGCIPVAQDLGLSSQPPVGQRPLGDCCGVPPSPSRPSNKKPKSKPNFLLGPGEPSRPDQRPRYPSLIYASLISTEVHSYNSQQL